MRKKPFKTFQSPALQAMRYGLFQLANWARSRAGEVDYVEFRLEAEMPTLPEHRNLLRQQLLGEPPLSLYDLENAFEQIAEDRRVKGVILYLPMLTLPLADLQTLRGSIQRLRGRGKQVICYAQVYDTAVYYVASAADQVILQPGGDLYTVGLQQTVTYQKSALNIIGVEVEPVAISPYKSALETFEQDEPSQEAREQFEWLLDSRYEIIVKDIARGRNMSEDAVREMIDTAPHLDSDSLEAGYVDAILNEEELPHHLKTSNIERWARVRQKLIRTWQQPHPRQVVVLEISGLIFPGKSTKPPVQPPFQPPIVGDARAGDRTVVQQVRKLMQDESVGAVVLFIDSQGGAAIAAESMTAALKELASKVPVVAFMNGVAASGGYYVATPAQRIVAQPGTITGSIGVLTTKIITQNLFNKLRLNRFMLMRGANADLFSDTKPFTEAQRETIRKSVEHHYAAFVDKVATSREMSYESVDKVGGGRVWTGKQALEHGLVDTLGDLQHAISIARDLAGLPDHAAVRIFESRRERPLGPQIAERADPAAAMRYLYDGVRHLYAGKMQMLLPFTIE